MSPKQTHLAKSLSLSLFLAATLTACQDTPQEPAADAAQAVDAAPDAPAVEPAPAPVLLGSVPTVSAAANERQSVTINSCNIELANAKSMDGEVPTVSLAADISIVGWFVNEASMNAGDPLVLKVSNFDQSQFWDVPVTKRTERQDIVAAFKNNPNLANAGFEAVLNLSQFPAGRYNVYLSHAAGSSDLICGQGRSITIE